MKLFLCAVAALTLSVSTVNAQEKADVINTSKTQVVKKASKTQSLEKADKTQSLEMKKAAKKKNKSSKSVMREDAKGVKSNYNGDKQYLRKKSFSHEFSPFQFL